MLLGSVSVLAPTGVVVFGHPDPFLHQRVRLGAILLAFLKCVVTRVRGDAEFGEFGPVVLEPIEDAVTRA
jgi:hypothetical protein